MKLYRLRRSALLITFLFCANASAGFLSDDEPVEAREEGAVVLPAPPKKEDLLRYDVSTNSTMNFTIDANSVSIADNTIVRFTSVITSASGAVNISHEGIRCKSAERKLYASGRPDGSWNSFPEATWRKISSIGANSYPATLLKEYFCDGESVAGKATTIVDRLRRKRPIR
jgi:hypothetical protein